MTLDSMLIFKSVSSSFAVAVLSLKSFFSLCLRFRLRLACEDWMEKRWMENQLWIKSGPY